MCSWSLIVFLFIGCLNVHMCSTFKNTLTYLHVERFNLFLLSKCFGSTIESVHCNAQWYNLCIFLLV